MRHDDHYRPPPTRFTRNGYQQADLRRGAHAKACAAGAVASSFKWLIGTYGLGNGPEGKPGTADDYDPSLDDLVDEFVRLMGITSQRGASVDKIMEAKRKFIAQHKLPLTTESEKNGTGPEVIARIYEQMRKGQDVELHLLDPAKDDTRGHAVSLVGINKSKDADGKDQYDVVVRDDSNQTAPRGDDEKPQGRDQGSEVRTRPGYLPGLPGVSGASNIYAWTAESPTASGGGTSSGGAAGTARTTAGTALGSGGTATPSQSQQILSESIRATFLAEKYVVGLEGLGHEPGSPVNTAAEIAALSARYLLRAAYDVMAYLEDPAAQNAALLEVYFYAGELMDRLDAVAGMLPPDADHDDVPDADDNCEYANPDQGDCNSNGLGDVCELNPSTDCNSNGALDDCELATGEASDCNANGRPDDCDLFGDADGDQDVDLADYAQLGTCLTGPCLEVECLPPLYAEPCCRLLDAEADGDVDLGDFAALQRGWTGEILCGNGVIDEGEQCDDGGESPQCDIDCTFPVCGDTLVNPAFGEECDDGNWTNGDGCSAKCTLEAPADCIILFDATCPNVAPECGALFIGAGDCLAAPPLCTDTPPQAFQVFASPTMIMLEGDLTSLAVHFAGAAGSTGLMEFFDAGGLPVVAPLWTEGDCLLGSILAQTVTFSRPVRSIQVSVFGGPVWIDTFHVNPCFVRPCGQ